MPPLTLLGTLSFKWVLRLAPLMGGSNRISILKEAMAEQWQSMTAMAGMFVATILLAIYIQPFWDRPEARAFGEAGTTKVGLIGLEFVLILIFTGIIIWLAKRGLQKVIKWAILFILWISLSYAMIPLASYALDDVQPEIAFRDDAPIDGEILFVDVEPNTYIFANQSTLSLASNASGLTSGAPPTTQWTYSLDMGNETYSAHPTRVVDNLDSYVLCDNARWIQLDKQSGEMLAAHNDSCSVGVATEENAFSFLDNFMERVDPFHPDAVNDNWVWRMPPQFNSDEFLKGVMLDEDSLLMVTSRWAGIVEIPDQQHDGGTAGFGSVNATISWQLLPQSDDYFTATSWGHSPWSGNIWWSEESTDRLLMLGSADGLVEAFVWDGEEMVAEEHIKFNERDAFDSEIQGIMLADDQRDGRVDVWIASGGEIRIFSGWTMVESATIEDGPASGSVDMVLHTIDSPEWDEIGIEHGILTIYSQDESSDSTDAMSAVIATPINQPAFILQDSAGYWLPIYLSQILALVASTILMIALTLHPEWYVVNTAGILTGAGVITIIGVSFVPPLILIFMIVTAIYDAYAVYKSKHMLDLADTMIDLKLPILLVAPQDKDYSFLDEGGGTLSDDTPRESRAPQPVTSAQEGSKEGESAALPPPPPRPKKKGGGDALFMGLGDVIFPGMLVVSALTFLPPGGDILGLSSAMFVAFGTLAGGLLGYMVLMSYVAMGRPQAGLPLLNGGSILGYLVTGFIAVGSAAISFGITFF